MKTPQQSYPTLAEALGIPELYFKREDLHVLGSHKGRSIPLMVKQYAKEGCKQFIISSSGNAALAAVLAIQNFNRNNPKNPIELTVYIGLNIDTKKKEILLSYTNDPAIHIEQVERPKQTVFQKEKEEGIKSLRQSTDDLALEGYHELAKELEKIPNLAAIFIPTSSGTTAQALGAAFAASTVHPQIHVVQTSAVHPIAQNFDTDFTKTDLSLAGAIVDSIAHRNVAVTQAIKNSQGSGWVVNDAEIIAAQKIAKEKTNLSLSPNSALAVAGLQKAIANNWQWDGAVVCLITGK